MGWKQSKEDAASRGGFVSLKEDGETVDFVALTEPEPVEKEGFKKGDKRNIYRILVATAPLKVSSRVQSLDLSIFSFNSYAGQIGEGHESKAIIRMTRHGKKNSLDTAYTFKVVKKLSPKLVKLAKKISKEIANVPF